MKVPCVKERIQLSLFVGLDLNFVPVQRRIPGHLKSSVGGLVPPPMYELSREVAGGSLAAGLRFWLWRVRISRASAGETDGCDF